MLERRESSRHLIPVELPCLEAQFLARQAREIFYEEQYLLALRIFLAALANLAGRDFRARRVFLPRDGGKGWRVEEGWLGHAAVSFTAPGNFSAHRSRAILAMWTMCSL